MFPITYLSTQDRKRETELRDLILRQMPDEEREKLKAELTEIEGKRKPLIALNVDECQALKDQLYKHYMNLLKIGRVMQARQFFLMLQSVDIRLAYLYATSKDTDADLFIPKDKRKKDPKKDESSPTKLSDGKFSSRWTIPIDDDN